MDPLKGEWGPSGGPQRVPSPPAPPGPELPLPTEVPPAPPLPWGDIEHLLPSSLSILLPALNEERGVEDVLKRIPPSMLRCKGLAYSVYLIDGRSTDRTQAIAAQLGAGVFVQTGRGKGSALREFVPTIKEDLTLFMDSDGTYPPEAIPDLVGVLGPETPVVLGSRFRGLIDMGAMSSANYLGNRFLSWLASRLFATPVSDVCTGMWGFVSDELKSLGLTASGFELEADIFGECALRRIPIVEVPIRYQRRIGEPKLHLREGVRIAFALLKKRIRSSAVPPAEKRTPQTPSNERTWRSRTTPSR